MVEVLVCPRRIKCSADLKISGLAFRCTRLEDRRHGHDSCLLSFRRVDQNCIEQNKKCKIGHGLINKARV